MDRREYESLDPEEQAKVFHHSPFSERAELLLHSAEPQGLTQSLSPEELYLVTREMDPEERVEIISYASVDQLVFLSDVDCWKKGQINPAGLVRWLETLIEADEDLLIEWFDETDYEMVIAGLKKLVHIVKPEWEMRVIDELQDRPYFTLDQYYYIFVKEENFEPVKRTIECLYEAHPGRYSALMEGLIGELDGEMEESAYRLRQIRLSERGFPDAETAQEIYRPITREEFDRYPLKREGGGEIVHREAVPDYPMLWSKDRLFLDEVILLFNDEPEEIREGLREEMVWLSNKLIGSDGIDFASEDRVKAEIERARRLVNIGLESLSDGDLKRAKDILQNRWLEIILRWGLSRLFEVREEARHLVAQYWKDAVKPFLLFLEPPYENLFRGLLKTVPQYFEVNASGDMHDLRDFKSMAEAGDAKQMVVEVKAAHEFLKRAVPELFADKYLRYKQGGAVHNLYSLLGTIYARYVLGEKLSEHPVLEARLPDFLKKAFIAQGGARVLDPAPVDRFLGEFFSPQEKQTAAPLWARVFQKLETELSGLEPGKAIDARYVTSLRIFKKKAAH